MNQDLLKSIEQVNDYTDQRTVSELRKRVEILNLNDERNKRIFEEAERKRIV